ncbi:MAG TPA: ABC transporter permease [Candidatus Cybelea sp.]|nr:ABC transporter permease [Candidatus Cybelea sp.]
MNAPLKHAVPAIRRIGPVNWIGVRTLYLKEVQRFVKVATQTLLAPVVTTLLFLAVFALALGGNARSVGDVPYVEFLAPGLVMMAIAQNAFANTASSVLISKVQGNIVDMLMPPISAAEFTLAYAGAGATRGVAVGVVVALAMTPFAGVGIAHPWAVAYYAFAAATMMSLLGLLGGLWADKFDHMAAVTNFVITPLAFLSGTFYSVERLPPIARAIAHMDPFFFMIDGFRFGFIGRADGSIVLGMVVLAGIDVALAALSYGLVSRGYKLKA